MKSEVKEKPIQELLKFSIINLDKPTGPTSFTVSHFVKNLLSLNKTSHFGTLDPQVTGVLPIGLSRACRLNEYFIHSDKVYVGIMRLHKEISKEDLIKEMGKFTGVISQLPPVRSRVKRELREREIKSFEILEIEGKDVLFKTAVQAGTYIRKLISDMGDKIGGAHMLELRRTRASVFPEEESVNLYDLVKAVESYKKGSDVLLRKMLIPAEKAITKVLPTIQINPSSLKQLLTGKPLMKQDIGQEVKTDKFALFHQDRFIGVYKKVKEKDIIARPEFIYN